MESMLGWRACSALDAGRPQLPAGPGLVWVLIPRRSRVSEVEAAPRLRCTTSRCGAMGHVTHCFPRQNCLLKGQDLNQTLMFASPTSDPSWTGLGVGGREQTLACTRLGRPLENAPPGRVGSCTRRYMPAGDRHLRGVTTQKQSTLQELEINCRVEVGSNLFGVSHR